MSELTNKDIAALRVDYGSKSFNENEINANPFEQFRIWFEEAVNAHINEPNAMVLSTVKADNSPSARVVLLKGITKDGFTFFTNYKSNKGNQISKNNKVALTFNWLELHRQVRIEGEVEQLSAEENDHYFYIRPIGNQIGAIASPQSQIITNRDALEKLFIAAEKQFENKNPIRPEHWGGYVVKPSLIEFWQGRSNRLHDRIEFVKSNSLWKFHRLAP